MIDMGVASCNFFESTAVPSPRGSFGGLSPPKQSFNPPKLKYETL